MPEVGKCILYRPATSTCHGSLQRCEPMGCSGVVTIEDVERARAISSPDTIYLESVTELANGSVSQVRS